MKLKFKKEIFLSLTAIALLSFGSCEDKDAISKNDKEAINKFDKNYFAKYNKTFIPNTDDENFKPSDLAFHTWAWQKYLYLTQNIKNEKGEKTKDGMPLFLVDKNIHQISPQGDIIQLARNPLELDIINQAGFNDPILKSNPKFINENNETEHTVYYSIHMNKIMINDMKDGATKLIDTINFKKANSNKDINITDSTLKYSNGALELKAAWINIEAIPEKLREEDYIQVKNVSILTNPEEKDKSKHIYSNDNTVALIGLHVVGMVNGFPELLWTTFEGKHLAPDNVHNLTDQLSRGQNNNIDKKLAANTDKEWLLYRKGKTTIENADNVITYKEVITNKDEYDKQVYRKYPLSVDIKHFSNNSENSQGFATHANLMNAMNKKTIKHNNIKMAYNANIWLKPEVKFDRLIDIMNFSDKYKLNESIIAGSPNATNITLESYMQNTQCFSCHGGTATIEKKASGLDYTVKTKTFLNTSHIFRQYLANKLLDSSKSAEPQVQNSSILNQKQNHSKIDREQVLEYIKRLDEYRMESGK